MQVSAMKLMPANSSWWVCEYATDIHRYLLEKEKGRIKFLQQSSQLPYRKFLIEFMFTVCEKLWFCTPVFHSAVYFLDAFMDQHSIQLEHLQLISLGCLMLAVKADEQDILIPRMSDFNTLLGNKYNLKEFVEIEMALVKFLNWDLLVPTAATFAEYYSLYSVSSSDMHAGKPLLCVKEAETFTQEYINYFLSVSIKDITFRQFCPSMIAASCIVAARANLLLSPTWPSRLRDITHYEFTELNDCTVLLLSAFHSESATKQETDSGSDESTDAESSNPGDSEVSDSDDNGCSSSPRSLMGYNM